MRRFSRYPAPLDRLPPPVAAALTGQGGAVAPVTGTGIAQDTHLSAGGQTIEGSGTYGVPETGTLLVFMDVTGTDYTGGTEAVLAGSINLTHGVRLGLVSDTELRGVCRRSTGTADLLSHTISDATAAGPQLYYAEWNPGFTTWRVGVGDPVAASGETAGGVRPGAGGAVANPALGGWGASVSGRDSSPTFSKAWALLMGRALTSSEGAAAAAGDYSWAVGDPDLVYIIAADGPVGTGALASLVASPQAGPFRLWRGADSNPPTIDAGSNP